MEFIMVTTSPVIQHDDEFLSLLQSSLLSLSSDELSHHLIRVRFGTLFSTEGLKTDSRYSCKRIHALPTVDSQSDQHDQGQSPAETLARYWSTGGML
jgi:hypothetical protein